MKGSLEDAINDAIRMRNSGKAKEARRLLLALHVHRPRGVRSRSGTHLVRVEGAR